MAEDATGPAHASSRWRSVALVLLLGSWALVATALHFPRPDFGNLWSLVAAPTIHADAASTPIDEEAAAPAVGVGNSSVRGRNDTDADAEEADAAGEDGGLGGSEEGRLPAECGNFSAKQYLAAVRARRENFAFMEPMRPGYGLTNQLICYANLVFFGILSSRTVVFPQARTNFYQLVDLSKSRFVPSFRVPNNTCEALAAGALPGMRMKAKRFFFMRKALARGAILNTPNAAMRKMHGFIHTIRLIPAIRMWDMYGRWPYGAHTLPAWQTLPWFLCGLRYVDASERQAEIAHAAIRREAASFISEHAEELKGENVTDGYVAVHLRMEPQDSSGMARSYANASNVVAFLEHTVFVIARRQRVRAVLVCAGRLADDTEQAMIEAGEKNGFRVLRKTMFNLTIPTEHVMSLESKGSKVRPTNSYGAVVDMLLLERAKAVVLTAYSSLTAAVYSRRCCKAFTRLGAANYSDETSVFSKFGGGPAEGEVYMYDVYDDGTLTRAAYYPCGYEIPEYVVGKAIPKAPPPLHLVFNPNLRLESPLFTDQWRIDRTGRKIMPPNISAYAPPPPPKKYVKTKKLVKKPA